MVVTNSITSLSETKKKTSLDLESVVSRSLISPYSATLAPITSLQLQHLSSTNSKQLPHNHISHTSDCRFPNSSSCGSVCEYCQSETHTSCSCSSESESDGELCTSNNQQQLATRDLLLFGVTSSCVNSISPSSSSSKSSFFKEKKKEQYRIRFEVDVKKDNRVNYQKRPKSPISSNRGPDSGAYAKSSNGDSGLTTTSSSCRSSLRRTQSPVGSSHQLQSVSSILRAKQSSTFRGSKPIPNISSSCNNIVTGNSEKLIEPTLSHLSCTLNKKPKRTTSLKKLLTKSKSFVFSSSYTSTNLKSSSSTLSRADLAAKYKQKSVTSCEPNSSNLPPVHSGNVASKWLKGFKREGDTHQYDLNKVCKSCGGISPAAVLEQDFCPTPKKYATLKQSQYSGYEQKSWLEMRQEDIYSYGRYSRLPSIESYDEYNSHKKHGECTTDFLSLQKCQQKSTIPSSINNNAQISNNNKHKKKDKEQDQGHSGVIGSGSGSFISTHKRYNKYRDEYSVQQVETVDKSVTMANYYQHNHTSTERVEFLDQDDCPSYYDCRIPRPKLKFVIPTHSYGVTSPSSKQSGRKGNVVDGFTEISLSDNENEDTAYGSGSGSHSSSSKSSKFRLEHSSDETLSEFEKEQEQPVSLSGTSRRLLSLKRSHFTPLWSTKHTSASKGKGDQQRVIELLKSLPLFRKLGSGFLTKLSDHVIEVSYDCGEYIIRQGSRGEGLFILMSGTAKVTFTPNTNGEEIYLRTLHPGDIFGEKALHGERVQMINVMTSDETATCLIITENGFSLLLVKSTDLRNRLCDKSQQTFGNDNFERIELGDLRLISTLGIGGFGRVELVTLASDQSQSFALKQMKKCQIVATRQIEHIKSEKAILMETNCDFITKLYKTFKDSKYLYMLMECCLGGELWTILRDRGHFNDSTSRFYVGCVLEALKYLHSRNIVYRDLKPENLLLDANGYVKLVDFGFSKRLEGNKTWTFCGTPEYVAAEIILNKGHDITADYWSLGVLMYELLTGTPPFVGGDPMKTYKLILKGMDYVEFPDTISKHAYTLIRKLCRENPEDRLGAHRGVSEIKRHKWFDGLDWSALKSRTLKPPITPFVRGPHDGGNFDEYPPDKSGAPDDFSGWDWDF